jgi:hypothetical protein
VPGHEALAAAIRVGAEKTKRAVVIAAKAAHGGAPACLLAPNLPIQQQHLGCCAPQCRLPLGHSRAPISLGRIRMVRIVARTIASAVARNNARVDPV